MKLLLENWRRYLLKEEALQEVGTTKCTNRFTREPNRPGGKFTPDPAGKWIKDPKNPENYLFINQQAVMRASCDPDSFDGDRYIVWGGRKVEQLSTTPAHMETIPKGSIYGVSREFYSSSPDLEDAKQSALGWVKSAGGKEILDAGGSINVYDRQVPGATGDSTSYSRN